MKKLLPAFLAVAAAATFIPALSKDVHVEPGSLHKLITAEDFKNDRSLRITGTLNNSDIIELRNLCGRDTAGKKTDALISDLDLRDVKFENSGAPYFLKLRKTYGVTSPTSLPPCMFYEVPIEKLILPKKLDTLGEYSLVYTGLRELRLPRNLKLDGAAIARDTLLSVLELPDMEKGLSPNYYVLPNLKSIRYGDIDYMPSGSFRDMPQLEEIIFDGMIGHIDGYQISNCPNLRRVIFNGPILSTGGPVLARNCPNLETVEFNELVVGQGLTVNDSCPALGGITVNGAVIESGDSTVIPSTSLEAIKASPEAMSQLRRLVDRQIAHMGAKGFLGRICRGYAPELSPILDSLGMTAKAAEMDSAFAANRNPDEGKSKLEILKEAAPYSAYKGDADLTVTYTESDDSLLTRSRKYFNLDSVAGQGDDITRIKNLLYWVHDLVRHDGSSSWPDCRFNLVDLYNLCKKEGRGLNCRFMAMMLTEALLAEGIPARYLTCMPKAYDEDSDCHVITVAWSESLNKWIWVDPTFAAYVTDENGLLLHPGEVRDRLRLDMPLVLNDDANWNHQNPETKEHYLDYYMAKNLYLIETNLIQQAEPEGQSAHKQGKTCTLVPDGFDYPNTDYLISDDVLFWQAPVR